MLQTIRQFRSARTKRSGKPMNDQNQHQTILEENEDVDSNAGDRTARVQIPNSNISSPTRRGPPPIYDNKLMDNDVDRIKVELFTDEKTLHRRLHVFFIDNEYTSTLYNGFSIILKFASIVMYCYTLSRDNPLDDTCYDCEAVGKAEIPVLRALLWVDRLLPIYIAQVAISFYGILMTLVMMYLQYKGNILQQILSVNVLLELITSVPFIFSLGHKMFIHLYVPTFFAVWLARMHLFRLTEVLMKNQSHLFREVVLLTAFILCLAFTCMSGVHYLERAHYDENASRHFNLFNTFWFVIVTFSTVGYGDFYPSWWPSQIYVIIFIVLALGLVPVQVEKLSFLLSEHQKIGTNYSLHRAKTEKHVVFSSSDISYDLLLDFLNEFYAYPALQDYYVVVLTLCELETEVRSLINELKWKNRVIYIQGSPLKRDDLMRAKMHYAECCFLMASGNLKDRQKEDEAVILRAWSVKDFAPNCPLHVQVLFPENKFHVQFADHVVCEDELKYAVLACNVICPAISTYVSLMLHTLNGRAEGDNPKKWQILYGNSTGQEIYDRAVEGSKFFKQFVDCNFTYASRVAHKKFGCLLIGVRPAGKNIILNPGPDYIIRESDTCYYINITSEEATSFKEPNVKIGHVEKCRIEMEHTHLTLKTMAKKLFNRESTFNYKSVTDMITKIKENEARKKQYGEWDRETCGPEPNEYVQNYPTLLYPGFNPPICHLVPEPAEPCCMNLLKSCSHKSAQNAMQYKWKKKAILISIESPTVAIANFIIPLRQFNLNVNELRPIVIMVDKGNPAFYHDFISAISCFPLVYYACGRVDRLDDLLLCGITRAKSLFVVDKESSKSADESILADSGSIVSVQTLYRFFPKLNIVTELTHPANMKFMNFNASEKQLTTDKKKHVEPPVDSHLFRRPFVAGTAFSISMLDTVLYQAFVKPYIVQILYLLLGLKQEPGSGNLGFYRINQLSEVLQKFGDLFLFLQHNATGAIPIGVYRCDPKSNEENSKEPAFSKCRKNSALSLHEEDIQSHGTTLSNSQFQQMQQLISEHFQRLNIDPSDANTSIAMDENDDRRNYLYYVIINPDYELQLQVGDIIYLLQPSTSKRLNHNTQFN